VALPPEGGRLPTALDELTAELIGPRKTSASGAKGAPRQTFAVADGARFGSADDAGAPHAAKTLEDDVRLDDAGTWDDARWIRQLLAAQSPDVDVVFWLAESAVPLWDEARRQIASLTGHRFVPDRVVLLWVALDFLATHLPLWLEAVRDEDPIAVRERFRCAIPGCTVHGGSGHHVRFRSRGGSDDPSNLLFVCYLHHIPGIHAGHVRVSGEAPDGLRIELGIRPDGTALETFVHGRRVLPSDQQAPRAQEDAA
jgi:hypothetical protein